MVSVTSRLSRRNLLRAASLALPLGASTPIALGRSDSPMTIVVPVPPGGSMDATARLAAEQLRPAFGTLIVENRPGGALRIAIGAVKRAVADGRTLLYSSVAPFTIYPHVYAKLDYDPATDFAPIAPVVAFDFAFAVPASSPYTTLAEFLAAARKDPDRLALYAVPSTGTASHFTGSALAQASGTPLKYVPYKGGAPAMQDLLGGHVPSSIGVLGEYIAYHRAGRIRVLATSGSRRSPFLPEVATFEEQGFPGLIATEQFGLFAPAGTPAGAIGRLNEAVGAAFSRQELRAELDQLGFVPVRETPAKFAATLQAARDRWGPVIKASGFRLED